MIVWITVQMRLRVAWQVKTTTVGVVIPNIVNSYFATLAKGIDDIATMYKV